MNNIYTKTVHTGPYALTLI